jgi:putative Holliday junction resolvase
LPRILALDVGKVRIGLAISDPFGWTAQPLPTWNRQGLDRDLAYLEELVQSRHVDEVIIGLPINLKGIDTPQTEMVRQFSATLVSRIATPVRYWDERFTTTMALRTLRRGKRQPSREKGLVDQVAAIFILQSYLDSGKASPLV